MPEKLYFELPTEKGDMEIPENSPLNYEVETDFYKGNTNNAVIIIVGKGGTTQGYQDKYVTIANNLVINRGVNVFVVENPGISRDDPELFFDCAIKFIRDRMEELGYDDFDLAVIGFSAGGHFTGRFAYKYSNIKQMLLINPVLRVDFEKLKNALNSFNGKIIIIQGEKDVDYVFSPLLKQIPKARVVVLNGVDHQFTNKGGLDLFIGLPEKYLS